MSKFMALFIALNVLMWVGHSNYTPNRPNLIKNPDFYNNSCQGTYCESTSKDIVANWTPDPQIEVGYGSFYSDYFKNERVLDLAPCSNSCVYQEIDDLEAGTYELRFEHFARKGVPFNSSDFSVLFNGFVLRDIKHTNFTLNVQTMRIPVWEAGDAKLSFCTTRYDNNPYGGLLKFVSLIKVEDYPIVPANWNWINNGNFTQTACRSCLCITKSSDTVVGWIPDPQIEIGIGTLYSNFLNNEWAIDLAGDYNGCIYQMIKDLQPGYYELKVNNLGRKDFTLDDSQFSVSWNDVVLRKVTPPGYGLNTETFNITVKDRGYGKLKLCSIGGKTDAYGVIIKSVSMIKTGDLAPIPSPVPVPKPQTGLQNLQLTIKSHSNLCYQRKFDLQGGSVQISFVYQFSCTSNIKDTATYVTLNGQPIYKVQALNNGQKITLEGSLAKGTYTIGFCPVGGLNETPHDITISQLNVIEKCI